MLKLIVRSLGVLAVAPMMIALQTPSFASQGQPTPKLAPVQALVQGLSLGIGAMWQLLVEFPNSKSTSRPTTGAELAANFDRLLASDVGTGDKRMQLDMLSEHRSEFRAASEKLGPRSFLSLEGLSPFYFVEKDGEKGVLLTGLISTSVYNTLRSTARGRAAEVVSNLVLPALKQLGPVVSIPDIKFCGILAVYGSKDFASSSVLNLQSEAVTVVVSVEQAKKYLAGDTADDDLVSAADVYLQDREGPTLKKIRLTLQ